MKKHKRKALMLIRLRTKLPTHIPNNAGATASADRLILST